MKKLIMVFLSFAFCLYGILSVTAEEAGSDIRLTEVIRKDTTQETREYLTSAHPYKYKQLERSLDGLPILTVYDKYSFTELYDKSLDEIYDALKNRPDQYEGGAHYIVLDEKIFFISVYDPYGDPYFDYGIYGEDPYFTNEPWLDDIVNNVIPEAVLQSKETLKTVFCLDNSADKLGTAVYYVMEDGSFFVKFYDGSERKEFDESEFRAYSKAYYEYLLSLIRYDEDGNVIPTSGGTPSFLSFAADTPVKTLEAAPTSDTATETAKPWGIVAAAGGVLALAAVAVFVFRKRKA